MGGARQQGKGGEEGRDQKHEGWPERLKSSRLKSQLAKISQEGSKVYNGRKSQCWNDVISENHWMMFIRMVIIILVN